MNLLKECNVSEILLAGFDGFSVNINQNYFDPSLRHPVTEEQAKNRNAFFGKFVNSVRETVKVTYLTKTIYN